MSEVIPAAAVKARIGSECHKYSPSGSAAGDSCPPSGLAAVARPVCSAKLAHGLAPAACAVFTPFCGFEALVREDARQAPRATAHRRHQAVQ